MLLAANVFSSVVSSLESESVREHRRESRVVLETRVTILPCPRGLAAGVGAPLSVPVRDVSRGGLRFLLPRRLPLDTQFIALLPAAAVPRHGPAALPDAPPAPATPEEPLAVLCAVAWWQPLAKDLFALGGQFVRALAGFPLPALPPRVVLPDGADGETPPGLAPRLILPGLPDASPAPAARRVAS